MPDERQTKLAADIKRWVEDSGGWFNTGQLDNDLEIGGIAAMDLRRQVLKRLCDIGILERAPNRRGVYRLLDLEAKEIDWQGADPGAVVDIRLPFKLHEYVKIYPKSIIVVAGSPNAGKTAFLYNFILMNMKGKAIELFNSETSPEQMHERMDSFELDIPTPAPFGTYERYDNFSDVIKPDRISVIDYLDLNSEVYLVGEEIDKIHRKLEGGIALIAIQKRPGQELGLGGVFSLKKATLYLSMERSSQESPGKLKIVKAKSWVDYTVDPNNMQWSFKLVKGAKFVDIKPIYGGER